MASQKRKALDLNLKVETIKLLDSGRHAYTVAELLDVRKIQIQNFLKQKLEMLNNYENNTLGSQKQQRQKMGNKDINNICLEWFKDPTKQRINDTDPMLKERALALKYKMCKGCGKM